MAKRLGVWFKSGTPTSADPLDVAKERAAGVVGFFQAAHDDLHTSVKEFDQVTAEADAAAAASLARAGEARSQREAAEALRQQLKPFVAPVTTSA